MASELKDKFDVQELVPGCLRNISVSTLEDIEFPGSVTTGELLKYWRRQERDVATEIKKLQEKIDILKNKTVEEIRQYATQFENPLFPKIGTRGPESGIVTGELEPLDKDSMSRKRNTTTMNVCGWCKFVGGGWRRYEYIFSSHCALMPETNVTFNTPCVITSGSQELLEMVVSNLIFEKDSAIAKRRQIGRYLRILSKIHKNTERKPALPNYRPDGWFNVGDRVAIFVLGKGDEGVITHDAFVIGTVTKGYRHHNGFVTVVTNEVVCRKNDSNDGFHLYLRDNMPEVLHEWELRYIIDHPYFAKVWLDSIDSANFDREIFMREAQNFSEFLEIEE
jgi:hypothetical protein